MHSAALSSYPSISLLRKPTPKPTNKFYPSSFFLSSKSSQNFGTSAVFSIHGLKLAERCSSDSFSINPVRPGWISGPMLSESESNVRLKVRATSAPESAGEKPPSKGFPGPVVLGTLFGLWHLFNIYINTYNKQVLKVNPYPVILKRMFNLRKGPKIRGAQLPAISPLAVVHTLGYLFTNMSLGKVAVSFTHTIKAMGPFFSVVLSARFLGEFPTIWVVSSLLPIVGGVALASMTKALFYWAGFWSAMASNLTKQYRNVRNKKSMVKKKDSLDNITLFSIITLMSFVLLAPATIFMKGVKQSGQKQLGSCILKNFAGICLLMRKQHGKLVLIIGSFSNFSF